ncbi:MAG: hypothetical protein JO006_06890 [Paucibacter sp.]|nr:hypothetical protein [Roseateles sp.]
MNARTGLKDIKAAAGQSHVKARWERIVMRRPGLALPLLLRVVMQRDDAHAAGQALLGVFFVLERWGRAAELQGDLEAALALARQKKQFADAAELSEALARLHYQRGDYAQACIAWSESLDWAPDESRVACSARVGIAHLCYALGEWARGGRVVDQAELHYPDLKSDAYLRAKIALNRAATLRVTQGPYAALPALREALAAAQQAGHRDYQAEAIWHHAKCARDSGELVLAEQLATQSLRLARACGYRWLQGQAALLLSELHSDDAALDWASQAMDMAEAIQSRSLQAAVHARLADLMRERGELGPSWHHQQQRQRLEATLEQGQVPARLEALARFDTDPHGADALLLALDNENFVLAREGDFEAVWASLRPRLVEALGLLDAQLWWDRSHTGSYACLPMGPSLSGEQLKSYFGGLPHRISEPPSRFELTLQQGGKPAALLWLLRPPGGVWSHADSVRAQRLAALIEKLLDQLASSQASQQRLEQALGGVAELVLAARKLVKRLETVPMDAQALRDEASGLLDGASKLEAFCLALLKKP